jgi:ATP-binding cassette, subfamily B, bacterial
VWSTYRRRLGLAVAAAPAAPLLLAGRIWLLKILIDTVLRGHRPGLVPLVAAAFVGIAVARGLLDGWVVHSGGTVGTHVVRDLRVKLFGQMQASSLRYFHGQRLGDLLTRLSQDIGAIEELLVSGLTAIAGYVITIVLFCTLLVLLDPSLVLVAFTVLPALAAVTVLDARRGRRAQEQIRERTSELVSTAEESLSAVAAVKAFARGGYETGRFAAAARRSAAARLKAVRLRAVFPPVAEVIAAAGTAAVVWIGSAQVFSGRLSLGSLVVFLSYLGSLYVPIQGLSRVAGTMQRALVGATRVCEVLATPAQLLERAGEAAVPPGPGVVEFRHVSFSYPDGPRVLHDVSFRIGPGEMVALIGASGAGKTTVVSLLLSYYDPGRGEVLLDGRALSGFGADRAREPVAAVLQEPMLFNTTIGENIRYGRLDASDEQVRAAAVLASADAFVQALPQGYDTAAGPRGARLSGGQRQRLALARALVKDAPVLVLDEATSALDPATEAEVLAAIRRATRDRAVLLVTHRLSAVSHADRVIVLEGGRIVQDGRPDELAAAQVAGGRARPAGDRVRGSGDRPVDTKHHRCLDADPGGLRTRYSLCSAVLEDSLRRNLRPLECVPHTLTVLGAQGPVQHPAHAAKAQLDERLEQTDATPDELQDGGVHTRHHPERGLADDFDGHLCAASSWTAL